MQAAMWDCNRADGTPGKANLNCTSRERETPICEWFLCRAHNTSWGPSERTPICGGGDLSWQNVEAKTERSGQSSRWPASWLSCCTISGSAARHTNRSTIPVRGDWQRHSSDEELHDHYETPSSGDCALGLAPASSR